MRKNWEPCPYCMGTGWIAPKQMCQQCNNGVNPVFTDEQGELTPYAKRSLTKQLAWEKLMSDLVFATDIILKGGK